MVGQRLHNGRWVAAGLGALALAGALAVAGPAAASSAPGAHLKGQHGGGTSTQPPLQYGGGRVLTSSTTYAIWWGTPTNFPTDAQAGIESLLEGFGGSSYLGIATQYMPNPKVAPASKFGGSLFDTKTAPPSHSPSTAVIANEVAKFFATPDPNALYLVYTSNIPHLSFCAWHAAATVNGVQTQIAYLPNTANVAGCDPGQLFDPPPNNYSEGTRSLADSTAHEFMETVTDPVPVTGWADKNGQEIGDKCNFVYDKTQAITLANGSAWQIQEEWSNAANSNGGACVSGN